MTKKNGAKEFFESIHDNSLTALNSHQSDVYSDFGFFSFSLLLLSIFVFCGIFLFERGICEGTFHQISSISCIYITREQGNILRLYQISRIDAQCSRSERKKKKTRKKHNLLMTSRRKLVKSAFGTLSIRIKMANDELSSKATNIECNTTIK